MGKVSNDVSLEERVKTLENDVLWLGQKMAELSEVIEEVNNTASLLLLKEGYPAVEIDGSDDELN